MGVIWSRCASILTNKVIADSSINNNSNNNQIEINLEVIPTNSNSKNTSNNNIGNNNGTNSSSISSISSDSAVSAYPSIGLGKKQKSVTIVVVADRFIPEKIIGRGRTSYVYSGIDKVTGMEVAIKIAKSQAFASYLQNESDFYNSTINNNHDRNSSSSSFITPKILYIGKIKGKSNHNNKDNRDGENKENREDESLKNNNNNNKNIDAIVMEFLGPSVQTAAELVLRHKKKTSRYDLARSYSSSSILVATLSTLPFASDVFSLKTVCVIAIQGIQLIRNLHSLGFVHGDIAPNKFLMDLSPRGNRMYLTGFELSRSYYLNQSTPQAGTTKNENSNNNHDGEHVPISRNSDMSIISLEYASAFVSGGFQVNRRDDMESFIYTLIVLKNGKLPWCCRDLISTTFTPPKSFPPTLSLEHRNRENIAVKSIASESDSSSFPKNSNRNDSDNYYYSQLKLLKEEIPLESLCFSLPTYFKDMLYELRTMRYDSEPSYEKYLNWFKSTLASIDSEYFVNDDSTIERIECDWIQQ